MKNSSIWPFQHLVLVAALGVGVPVVCGQVVTFSFTGAAGSETTLPADAQPTGATVSDISRGGGLTVSAGANTFNSSGFTTGGSLDTTDFYSFTITPDIGFQMDLTRIEVDERRSGSGIRNWSIYSSLDTFTTALASFSVPDDTNTRTDQGVNLSVVDFSNLTSALEFRIYGFAAELGTGTWRVDNVQLFGAIEAAPVPEPATYAGFAGGLLLGFAAWRRSVRRA